MEDITKTSKPILDLLYHSYDAVSGFTCPAVQNEFNKLDILLSSLNDSDHNHIIESVCALCSEAQKTGFITGIEAGFE